MAKHATVKYTRFTESMLCKLYSKYIDGAYFTRRTCQKAVVPVVGP